MISAVNLQRKFILILMFLGGQFSGGKVVSFQAEKTNVHFFGDSKCIQPHNGYYLLDLPYILIL
jgi:hypothetical protein